MTGWHAGSKAELGNRKLPVSVQPCMRANKARRTLVRLAAAVVVMFGVLSMGSPAGASCFRVPDVEADLASTDLVFVGSVTHLANENRWATFRVEEVWKGDPGGDRVEVRAGPGGRPGAPAASSNDRTYVAGQRYLVFASDLSSRPEAAIDFGEGARWVDGACSATRLYESSLDRFRPADAHLASSETTSRGSLVPAVVVAAALTLPAAAVAAIALRRRSARG